MRDFLCSCLIGLLFIGICAALVGVIAVPVGLLAYASCASHAKKMGLDYSWGPLQDCMVLIDGQWVPLESYKTARVRQ